METWLPAVSVHRYLSPLDWFRHDSAWGQGLPQDVTVNKHKMSRRCGHQGRRRRFLEATSRPYGQDNVPPSIFTGYADEREWWGRTRKGGRLEDVDDLGDEDDIKSVLGLPCYRYRHDRAIKIRGSAEDDDDLPSIDPPGENLSEIGEWIVLDLLEDSGNLSLLCALHRLFPHEHLSICEASTLVSSFLPSLDSSSTPIPLTPPPTSTSTHPSSLLPSLPHNYGALAFPEWPRKAGMGNKGGAVGCPMWGLAHTREEGEEDCGDDEEDDADYDQEQSDRMALEPSGVVTSIPPFASPATTPPAIVPIILYRRSGALYVIVLVDGHRRELQHSRSDELHEQGLACRPSMPSLLFGGSNMGRSGGVLEKRTERKKDRTRTIHTDEPADAEGKKKSGPWRNP
ncbi:hypothetical protein EV421DRAFT_2036001 [Armillaria borealis]|uniref:Uncharacterized protein n=1 Tax=Armillaria borealis TaxID=47425 RepID=A0AA39JKK4_9AGAR|nr:hypothetical protein EV421DRAFT_2036001 [Armillaria borealis]